MEGEEGGIRLSKRFSDKDKGEVDYKTKAGTAWSHSYLNQKPWHPLSYPNQRRKWIAEQTHANRERRAEEVAREYAQEQEFFRQTALISKKEKEKVEMMKAVSFMYVRPPGYNPESAKAAELADADDDKTEHQPPESVPIRDRSGEEKKKPRPKDVFGRHLPTEEEFEVLKNAPRSVILYFKAVLCLRVNLSQWDVGETEELTVYGIATNREAFVASSLERLGTEAQRSWKVLLLRNPNDWETGVVDEFLQTLGSNLPHSEQGDRMIWKLSKKGGFDIRSFYDKLRSSLPIIFPWKGIWKAKASTHASFFVWTATWEKILTGDILRCRGFDFVDWCILCRCNGEMVNHLLLHCEKAYQLWSLVFRSFGISWVLPRSVADTLFACSMDFSTIEFSVVVTGRLEYVVVYFECVESACGRLETGVAGRVKPFGVEVRNVKCLRCGTYGHQSGDRECPLKDAIMPNEESRLKRDDPLNAIIAQTDPSEPLKWELKQKPGISPPRGGFKPDDPNQQIVAEDIFDEYGGFLGGGDIPQLLSNFSSKPKKSKKKHKQKKQQSPSVRESKDTYENEFSEDVERRTKNKKHRVKEKRRNSSESSSSDRSEFDRPKQSRHKHSYLSEDSDADRNCRSKKSRDKHPYSSEDSDFDRSHRSDKSRHKRSCFSEYSNLERHHRNDKSIHKGSYLSEDSDLERHHGIDKSRHKHSYSSDDADPEKHHRGDKSRHKLTHSSKDSDSERHHRSKRSRQKQSYSSDDSDPEKHRRSKRSGQKQSYSSEDSDPGKHCRSKRSRQKQSYSSEDSDPRRYHRIDKSRNKSSLSHSIEDSDKGHHRSKYHR
uniref:CBF1-interacting co-repressor CIR N-terminal domain-containing protein n=1 Tax=Quercus lobata TaxID=97700 RepID=A0A7N2N1T7_QUELO